MPLALFAVRVLVSLILFSAGWAKARDPKGFANVVKGLGMLPARAIGPTARVLPWVEMGTAVILLWGPTAPLAAIIGFGLLGTFSAAMALALARGSAPECGCFGNLAPTKASWNLVARNLVLIALLVPVALHLGG
jgi:uncharacterized membrane protein YphA (DoxX/SURF4 family)